MKQFDQQVNGTEGEDLIFPEDDFEIQNLVKIDSRDLDSLRKRIVRPNIDEVGRNLHWSSSMLVSIFSLAFVAFILYKAVPGAVFFSIHPICMSLAYGFLMFQAVMLFSSWPLFSTKTRAEKVTLHWSMQVTSLVLSAVGFIVIYYEKYSHDKAHFTTWHGLFGLITCVMTVLQSVGGVMAKYPLLMKKYQLPLTVKAIHAFAAIITFSLIAITFLTGLQTNYFTRLTKDTTVFWQVAIAVPPMMAVYVVFHVLQSYTPRFRNKA